MEVLNPYLLRLTGTGVLCNPGLSGFSSIGMDESHTGIAFKKSQCTGSK